MFAQAPAPRPAALTAEGLFNLSRIWTVHLTFSRQEWAALRPSAPWFGSSSKTDGFVAPEGRRNGISGLRGLDFQYTHANLEIDTLKFGNVGVRYKGNGTYRVGEQSGKVSLKVDLNKFVKGQKLAGLSTINLHSNITDASWMNEVLAYRLYRDAGAPAPRTSYARVYVTVTGERQRSYLGLYSLVENVDSNFAQDRYNVAGGDIFKPVTEALFTDRGKAWASYNQRYDPKTDLTPADEQRVMDLAALVSHADDRTFAARLPEFVDLDAFATHLAVLVWLANPDSMLQQGQNFYVYLHPKTRQMAFIPWDQDHSFGQFAWSSAEQQQRLDILRPCTRSCRFLDRALKVPAFRQKYLAKLAALTRTLTLPARIAKQVDDLAAAIGPVVAQEPDRGRVALFKAAVAGQRFERRYYGGMATPVKQFVPLRQAAVLAQLKTLGIQ